MIIVHDTGCYLGLKSLDDANKVIMQNSEELYKQTRDFTNPCLMLFNPLEPDKVIYPNEKVTDKNLIISYQIFQDVKIMKTRRDTIEQWLMNNRKLNDNFVIVVPNISVLTSRMQGYCDMVMMSRNMDNNQTIVKAIANILKESNDNA